MSDLEPRLPEKPVGGNVDAQHGTVKCEAQRALEAAEKEWLVVVCLGSQSSMTWPQGDVSVSVKNLETNAVETRKTRMEGVSASVTFTGSADATLEVSARVSDKDADWTVRGVDRLAVKADGSAKSSVILLDARVKRSDESGRTQAWGTVHVVSPGIGVELVADPAAFHPGAGALYAKRYVEFIAGLVKGIHRNPTGRLLLEQFDPGAKANRFLQIDKGSLEGPSGGAYAGLTVVIGPPTAVDKEPFRTVTFGGRKAGKKVFAEPTIPYCTVEMEEDWSKKPWGKKVLPDGIVHGDFPKKVRFETAFVHELLHAYYQQAGISQHMADAIEEQMVCGMVKGRGLLLCENRYHYDEHEALRAAYQAVSLKDETVAEFNWGARQYTDPAEVLRLNDVPIWKDPKEWPELKKKHWRIGQQ